MNDKKGEIKTLKIVYPNIEDMPEDLYANHVVITRGEEDVILYFGKFDPPMIWGGIKEIDEVKAKVVSKIRITQGVANKLKDALEKVLKEVVK